MIFFLVRTPGFAQTPVDFFGEGGEISYKFLRMNPNNGSYVYLLTMKMYKACNVDADLPNSVTLDVFVNDPVNGYPQPNPAFVPPPVLPRIETYITNLPQPGCSDGDPVCYEVGVYQAEAGLLGLWEGYILDYQSQYRQNGVFVNHQSIVPGSRPPQLYGFTYLTYIPGTQPDVAASFGSSPVFNREYPPSFCTDRFFRFDFSALDPDGDSLTYNFSPSFQGFDNSPNGLGNRPPFKALTYFHPYTATTPMGPDVVIDRESGVISGIAPKIPGKYIVAINIFEWRNGQVVGRHRKEIPFVFYNCIWPTALIDSVYKNCNGFDVLFKNYSAGTITSYTWDFGDPSTNADTSSIAEPTYRYPAPGIYYAKLVLNRYGGSTCRDSAIARVIVDSGMVANFYYQREPICNQAIYHFFDSSSQSTYPINTWAWDFGEPTVSNDISGLQDPVYAYPLDGYKRVRMIIGNQLGCTDTMFKTINIVKSLLKAPNDTTLCYIDTIRLNANTGHAGTYSWSPNYNISSTTTADPLVSPDVTTTYQVTFVDSSGCVATDNVHVTVRSTVNLQIETNDTTICRGDSVILNSRHDGLSVSWQPVHEIIPVDLGRTAVARPFNTTPVIATAHLGSCFATDTMIITVAPIPVIVVNNDTSVCLGAPVYLHATGGSIYSWTPATSLDDPDISSPVAYPKENTIYKVTVRDTLGCPKPVSDSVRVTTFRGLFARAEVDTLIVEGESVQLIGSGGQYYEWSPPDFLSNPFISDPVARPFGDITYRLRITDDDNCVDYDSIRIRAFREANIYVPTAFTPNGDGLNDVFRVMPVSFDIDYLKIFDRWGNELFSTSNYLSGWDGMHKGHRLATGTFVWLITGRNKKDGSPVLKKGTVTLIR